MPPIDLILLGGFTARAPDRSALRLPAKARALVAYLARRPGTFAPRDTLAALLWSESPDAQARDSLRHAIGVIRRSWAAYGVEAIRTEGQAFALDPGAVTVDTVRFEQLAAAGAPEAWREAAALYGGVFLDGLSIGAPEFDEWVTTERERLRTRVLDILARLLSHEVTVASTTAAFDAATQTALRVLSIDPLHEGAHRALMRLYTYQDRRGSALRQYQQCVATLRHELGTEPEPETRHLYEEILQRRVADVPRPRATGPARATHAAGEFPLTLVGRETERASLQRVVELAHDHAGRVLVIIGESGIGKSVLLRALAAQLDQARSRVMGGRCHESTQTLPFGPWIDAFRSGGVTADDEAVTALERHWRAEVARLLPELGAPGLPAPGPHVSSLFEGVAELIRSFAQRELVVLTLEDVHWADDMSLRLLAFVARRLAAWRAVVAVTARADQIDRVPLLATVLRELSDEPHAIFLRPAPLSRADTAALVVARMRGGRHPDERAELMARLWAIGRGNPYVTVEALRAIEEATAPDSQAGEIEALVQGRFSRLSEAAHRILEIGATVGRDFEFALAHEASALPRETAAAAVEELVRRGILEGSAPLGEESFDFTHERIRQIAYQRTPLERRRDLHRLIARAIEQLHAAGVETFAPELARHYERAEEWLAAVSWLQRSALMMAFRSAYQEAAAALAHARALVARIPGHAPALIIDLCLDQRNIHLAVGEFDRAVEMLRRAEALAERAGDTGRLARIVSHMSHDAWVTGDGYPSGRRHGERALALARRIDDVGLFVEATFFLGSTCVCGGDYQRAIDILSEGAERLSGPLAYERFGLPYTPSCLVLAWLAWALADVGRADDADNAARRTAAIAAATGDMFSAAVGQLAPGLVLVRSGRAREAVAPLGAAVKACQEGDIHLLLPYAAGHLGYALALAGNPAEGTAVLGEVIAQSTLRRFVAYLSRWTSMLGEAQLLAGDHDGAAQAAAGAFELAQRYGERGNAGWADALAAAVAAAGGNRKEAERRYDAALACARTLGMRPLEERVVQGLTLISGT
jgi:DNA-binding SARP family transcriptional activator